jgi:hypothetical protein
MLLERVSSEKQNEVQWHGNNGEERKVLSNGALVVIEIAISGEYFQQRLCPYSLRGTP